LIDHGATSQTDAKIEEEDQTIMLLVTGHVQVGNSDLSNFTADLLILADAARRRHGNRFFHVEAIDADTQRLRVVELWLNQTSLTAHLEADDTAAFVARWSNKMSGDMRKYDVVNPRMLTDD
jgi:quinol monooxygenase YgiN